MSIQLIILILLIFLLLFFLIFNPGRRRAPLLIFVILLFLLFLSILSTPGKQNSPCDQEEILGNAALTFWGSDKSSTCSRNKVRRNSALSTVGLPGRQKPVEPYDRGLVELPEEFRSEEQWKGLISEPLDQGNSDSCWAYSATSTLSDRIRIATRGKVLRDDYILPSSIESNNIPPPTLYQRLTGVLAPSQVGAE